MAEYQPRLDDIFFTLTHVAGLEEVSKLDGYQHADPDTVGSILDEAGRFFSEVMAPLNVIGDQQGSVLTEEGTVKTPDGFKEAYDKYIGSGWASAHLPERWGGGGLPYLVGVVIQEMFKTANMAFSLAPTLTHGAVEALERHGSDDLKTDYIERLVSGEWAGTMNLTEPEAGSDVGALRTKAIKQDDGSYRLFGTKIFITWGDQDLTDNIIHLVLARTPDAPPGTRGISMFLVPKFILDSDGEPGERNDYRIVSLEHKLGIHASPTCVISFGDTGEGAVGYLIGDEQEGMRNMFTMMNAARVGVGMEGVAIGERAYQQALKFARERVQGRPIGSGASESVPIIEHPDVRRMLLTMKAYVEAMRSLLYVTAGEGDHMFHGETDDRRRLASDRLALLTPIVKAWCTDVGVELASIGVQIHGGMGYIEETGAAQHFRDSRIAPIYEGTNGIQAVDLVLRKVPLEGGAVVAGLLTEMTGILDRMVEHDELALFREELSVALQGIAETSTWVGERLASGDLDSALAGATPYLRQFGTVLGGWLLATASVEALSNPPGFEPEFLAEKVNTARFYGEQLLPMANGLVPAVKGGAGLLQRARF
ncbi:MAG TPA: acyl-CoA dehydrogenase [Acidimicrobiia bacterium]|jgi:alkylation response protein AidB-like acyl-CoA dehydrogenase